MFYSIFPLVIEISRKLSISKTLLASAQSAAVHEMNQKKAANNDIIKAVSTNIVTYPLMFFACGMTVRALAKGLSSCIKGGKKSDYLKCC